MRGDALDALVARVFGLEPAEISDDLGPEDVEPWDSLKQLELIVALEEHYGFKFEIEEVFRIFTIGDIRRILSERGL